MARGNEIIVAPIEPKGRFMEGYIAAGSTVLVPGTAWQVDATVALKGGRHTMKIYQPGTDGEQPLGPIYILLPDRLQGRTATDAYTAGDRAFFYAPLPGDELNMIVLNLSGTADDHPLGEKMMLDTGTGKLIVTTGSPEQEVAELLEAITDPVADTLAWVHWSHW